MSSANYESSTDQLLSSLHTVLLATQVVVTELSAPMLTEPIS